MNNIQQLLNKIDNFYQKTASHYLKSLGQTFSMPDDPEENEEAPELYMKMLNAVRQISNPDISSEILLIAELYKKALELNNGFNFVNKAISNVVNLLDDEDDEEQSAVEDLMNEVSRDVRQRAKAIPTGDNDAVVSQLRNVKNELNNRMIEQELEGDQPSMYEAGLSQYDERAKSVFDPTGGVSQEIGQTKGRGYRMVAKSYKDWTQSFENERDRFSNELTSPELQLSRTGKEARENASARANLQRIVDLLNHMIDLSKQATQLEANFQATNDPAMQQELNKVKEELHNLQNQRRILKTELRSFTLKQSNKNLLEDLSSAKTDQEKFLVQQKIELNNLMMSQDRNKGEESKWRRVLIGAMSGGNVLPPNEIAKIQQKINEGATKKTKAADIYKEKAQQASKIKSTKEERKSGKVADKYNWDLITLDGLVEHLTGRLATERIVVKQKITDKLKKAEKDPAGLKPIMDDLAKAATKRDKVALLTNIQRLKEKMNEFKNVQPELVGYVISLRTSKFFYNFRDQVKTIGKWLGEPLSTDQISFIDDTIRDGKKLAEYYKNLKIKPMTPGWQEKSTHYNPPIEIIEKIVKNLESIKYGQS